ncbi:hypothetical protein AZE42_11982 [Rhizopogon vesiculosus]|uniref:F-box domain-containing protein n=1 Tax=Rhizopogon vesiculosus TaxID=180088 RepID=A0A1J8R6V7_9AGAM|nr:hypothetical protein AZE42_11982 [Rhizopogon vesiculosus]
MHISLLATEILLDIFATINDGFRVSSRSRATIAALARTCRAFKEPALDTLWKNIDGFEPLISCLPEGIVGRTTEGQLTLTRPLSLDDWNIIGQYAHRIRSLTITSSRLNNLDDQIVRALVCPPSSALLPNLRYLEWWDERECFFPLLRTLLVPTFRSLKLASASCKPWEPSCAKSSLLASLGAQCPSIQRFVCAYSDDSHTMCEFVCSWQKLLHLNAGVLNTPSLHHLASLPSLKSLHFRTLGDVDEIQPNYTPTFSSHLDEVYITAPIPHFFAQRLRNVRFLSCQSAVLLSGDHDPEFIYDSREEIRELHNESLDIPNLMISFSECFSPDLEQIKFDFSFFIAHGGPPLVLGFNSIAPLLSFGRLTKLDLRWFNTSTIDDDALNKIAQSWPQLKEFYLGTAHRELISPSLTFVGLTHLIRHCRHLRTIAMSFRACSMDTNCEPFSNTIPSKKITRISVGVSPIVDPIAVASQLHMLLPNLTDVPTYIQSSLPHPFEHIKDNWSTVAESLKVLIAGAKMDGPA